MSHATIHSCHHESDYLNDNTGSPPRLGAMVKHHTVASVIR